MQYVPYKLLGTTDNIIVDGKANQNTRLILSHWPGAATPDALRHDLSVGMVFNYLNSSEYRVEVEAASNNHFDEDGLASLWTLLNPEEALEQRELLLDVASAGDFGTYKDRDAARISFILKAWTKPEVSPLNQTVFDLPYEDTVAVLYEELLPRFSKILERYDYLYQYWKPQDELLEKSERQLETGEITIEDHADIDLAIVTLPQPEASQIDSVSKLPWDQIVHEMAIHNTTDRLRILVKQAKRYKMYFRYESWVQLVSRTPMPRVDMTNLAKQLSTQEGDGASWQADDIDGITPSLWLDGRAQSKIAPDSFVEQVISFLKQAKPTSVV